MEEHRLTCQKVSVDLEAIQFNQKKSAPLERFFRGRRGYDFSSAPPSPANPHEC